MPFTDTPDGQTHYQNDGCGVGEHNDMQEQKAWYEDGMNAYANGVEEALGYCHREELRQYTEWMIQKATERGREQGLREVLAWVWEQKKINDDRLDHEVDERSRLVLLAEDTQMDETIDFIHSLLSQQEGK